MDSTHLKQTNWTFRIITLFLLVGLVGCSTANEGEINTPSEIPPTAENKPKNTVTPTEPSASTTSDVITIYFYHDISFESSKQQSAIATLISQFNQDHKDEIIVHQSITHPGSGEYYAERVENADCFLGQIAPESAASSGVILNLTAFMAAEAPEFKQDFDPRLLNEAQFEGNLYVLPVYTQPPVMVYNADLLAELGLEPPSLDWTFDDFLEIITAVATASSEKQIYGFLTVSRTGSTTEMFYAGRGVQWRDTSGDSPAVMINSPEMEDAITWMAELRESGIIFDASAKYTSLDDLKFGRIGFWTADAGRQYWALDYPPFKLSFNVGIVPLPFTDTPNGPFARSYDTGFYISSQTEHPEACWELAKTISSGSIIGIPVRTSVANSEEWIEFVGVENAAVYQAAYTRSATIEEVAAARNFYFWYPISDWQGQAVENINNGGDAAEELTMAQQYADAYLACMAPIDILSLSTDELRESAESCQAQVEDLMAASNPSLGD